MNKLEIEYLPITDLTPYEKNTRKHGEEDVDKIAKSIQQYGFNDPVGVWGEQNIIVEGHGRVLAAQQLEMTCVPVIRLDHLDDEQRRAYAIAHNRTAEFSGWDFTVLEQEMAELDFGELDLGFDNGTDVEIDDFFEDSEKKEKEPKRIQCPHCGEWFEQE